MNTNNLFAKVFNSFLAVLFAVASLVSPVAAKAPSSVPNPDCQYGPQNLQVEKGTSTRFYILNPDSLVSYMWTWGDGSTSTGTEVEYAWYTTGNFAMSVVASGPSGITRCNSKIVVTPIQGSYGGGMYLPTDTATPIVTPTPAATATPSATPSVPVDAGNDSKTRGNNSPIINGNNNRVVIKIEQAAQPTTVAQATQATIAPLKCPTPAAGEQIICSRGDLIIASPQPVSPAGKFLLALANWIRSQTH